jgi:predicted enzyme related to lactoylglutathione lyase
MSLDTTAQRVALRGLTTLSLWADDVAAAAAWYTEVLGVQPYFRRPEAPEPPLYVEFRLGDYQHELGIVDRRFVPRAEGQNADEPGGVIAYWHVDDVHAAFDILVAAGATEYERPTVRGEGFVTAAVVDPFGNLLGVMQNAHYLEILGQRG